MIQTDVSELKFYKYCTDVPCTYTIYSLVNLKNGKRYIGRTHYPRQRIQQHFWDLKSHKHSNILLNNESYDKFGFEILEEGILFTDRTDKERDYIIKYKTYDEQFGYNAKDPCLKGKKY